MSWLVISGIALPAFDVSMGTADGAFARGLSGAPMALSGMRGSVGERRSYQTPPLDFSTAMFWWRLFAREGDVWSFEANDDVSSHGVPTIDSIAPATSNPKFGTYHAARSGADIDVAAIPNAENFTVAYWYDDGNGYVHVLATQVLADTADRIWVDGVRNDSYSAPHTITAGTFTLTVNGDFDDIVVLPFGTPTTLASQWDRVNPFSSLPRLSVRGDGARPRVCEVVGRPRLSGVGLAGDGVHYRVSFDLRGYERPSTFEPLPDFDGLTRIEWAVEMLPGGHLSPVGSWTDIGPLGLELTQTGTARPTFRNDGALGDCVRADGVDDFLATAGGQGLDMSGGLTWFSVHARSSYANNAGLLAMRKDASARSAQTFEVYQSTTNDRWVYAVNRSPTPIEYWFGIDADLNTTSPVLWSVRMDGTNLNAADAPVRQNGELVSVSETGTPDGPNDTVDIIELYHGYNGAKFTGDIYCSALYFGRPMTLAEVQRVEAALNARYGVY